MWDMDTAVGNRLFVVVGHPVPDSSGHGCMHPVLDLVKGERSSAYEPARPNGSWEAYHDAVRLA